MFFIQGLWARRWKRRSIKFRRLPYRWRTRAGDFVSSTPQKNSARDLAQIVLAEGMPQGVLLNVNVPLVWNGGVRLTRQSKKVTRNVLQEGTDPRGRSFYWLLEQEHIEGLDPKSDYAAIFDGAVSVTPLCLDRTHETSIDQLSHWASKLESNADSAEPVTTTRPTSK